MRYQGSEAYNINVAERGYEQVERQAAPAFEVVPGGGLDARARAGVSPKFLARVRVVVTVAVALVVLGMARVGISAATVSLLSDNATISDQIEETTTLNEELKVQRSVLSSNSRISRIATQNYGMVLTGDAVTLTLDADGASGDEAATDAAATDDTADAADADGEAAQTDGDAATDADVS